jgi:hypothetical protein
MNLLGIRPAEPSMPPPEVMQMDRDLDDQLRRALMRHKIASDVVIKKSFDQVQRSADVQVVIRSLIDKIDKEQDHLEKAYDLIRKGHPENDDS